MPGTMNQSAVSGERTKLMSSEPAAATSGPAVMKKRGPNRPESAPNRPESRTISTVVGNPTTAASVAGSRTTCCRKIVGTRPARLSPA